MRKTHILFVLVCALIIALALFQTAKKIPVTESTNSEIERIKTIEEDRYYSDAFGFSLELPPEVRWSERPEGRTSATLSFEDRKNMQGFQIFVTPYKEATISQERFLMDIPSGIRKQEEQIRVGGVEATAFVSEDLVLGATREIWLLKDGYLFEITAPISSEAWLSPILSSWTFE